MADLVRRVITRLEDCHARKAILILEGDGSLSVQNGRGQLLPNGWGDYTLEGLRLACREIAANGYDVVLRYRQG